ncbi:MAG: hypothetical protein ACO22U_08370 [bacterium]
MKVWKITWLDKRGRKRTRYKTNQHESLKRLARIKRDGLSGIIESASIPGNKFELVDFINGQITIAEGDSDD